MKPIVFALILLGANIASAENSQDIQNHAVQTRFASEPCTNVIKVIDQPNSTPEGVGAMAMTFGFLMGFEVANPGIRGDQETILIRLRNACAEQPNRTGLSLLEEFAGY